LTTYTIYIAPLNLEFESFYGANIQFYFYFFVFIGTVQLLRAKDLDWVKKALILFPIILQSTVVSFLLIGTFRYRAPIEPLFLILASVGIRSLLFNNLSISKVREKASNLIPLNLSLWVYAIGVLSLFLATLNFTSNVKKLIRLRTNWTLGSI
jgi:hypothetical protein